MSSGTPDYTKPVQLLAKFGNQLIPVAVDENGQLYALVQGHDGTQYRPLRVDDQGRIVAVMTGEHEGALKIIATDDGGRIQALLYGLYGSTPTPVAVSAEGKLVVSELDQSEVKPDPNEATTWDDPLTSLVSNLNRIRNMIVRITGEAWGTVSRSLADIWAKFNATDGHKHTGEADDAPKLDASAIGSGRFPMARMPDGTAGYVLTAQGSGKDPAYAPPPTPEMDWEFIAACKLTSAAATVEFADIPTDYVLLLVLFNDVCGDSVDVESIRLRFNGDSGANYAIGLSTSKTYLETGVIADSDGDDYHYFGRLYIWNFADAYKPIWDYGVWYKASSKETRAEGPACGMWANSADRITSIEFFPRNGNFRAGSQFVLYGWRGS